MVAKRACVNYVQSNFFVTRLHCGGNAIQENINILLIAKMTAVKNNIAQRRRIVKCFFKNTY